MQLTHAFQLSNLNAMDSKDLVSLQYLGSTDKSEALGEPPPRANCKQKQSSAADFMTNMTKMLAAVASKQAKAPVSSNHKQNKNGGFDPYSSGDSVGDILKHKSKVFKSVESDVTNSLERADSAESTVPLNRIARSISDERDAFGEKSCKSVDSGVFHSLLSVGNRETMEALKSPARSSTEGRNEESSQVTGKRKAVSTSNSEENDSKASKRELANFFRSSDGTNEILKQELFKSVVADELKSLNSVGNSVDVMAAPLARTSSSSSGRFLQSMLGTIAPMQKEPPTISTHPSSCTGANVNRSTGGIDWETIQREGFRTTTTVTVVLDNGDTRHGEATAASGDKKKPKRPPRKRKSRIPLVKNYFEPTDNDVLCGRGGRANNHPGNKKYLELKDEVRPRYTAATKAAKTGIAEEVVDAVINDWGGRFLALDTKEDRWYEIDRLEARRKCSQALREENTAEARAMKRAKYPKKKKADKERDE